MLRARTHLASAGSLSNWPRSTGAGKPALYTKAERGRLDNPGAYSVLYHVTRNVAQALMPA
ncbi:MAG: hypothetical protein M3Z36_09365, partial [Acidobacteriota bacterium]|nr:hypothetical protein [Acidobacteriota bacterium]